MLRAVQRRSKYMFRCTSTYMVLWCFAYYCCLCFVLNQALIAEKQESRLHLIICTVHRVSAMDGTKLSVTTLLNATCTNYARNPWKENAFCFLLLRSWWRCCWLIKWRGVRRLVQTCTTKLFVPLANCTGRKILHPGATLPAPRIVETLQSSWTFSWTHVPREQKKIFQTGKKRC